MNIYFDNLQLILNSDNTDEDKQNQLLDLIKSIENDLLLGSKEKEILLNQIKSTSTNIMLNLDLYNLKKLRNYAKKDLFAFSSIGLIGTAVSSYSIYNYIFNHEQILKAMKNSLNFVDESVDILFGNLAILILGFFVGLDFLSYETLQEYLGYNKKINSYQRRLKDNHK